MQEVKSEVRGRCTSRVESAVKIQEERSDELSAEHLGENSRSSGKTGKQSQETSLLSQFIQVQKIREV